MNDMIFVQMTKALTKTARKLVVMVFTAFGMFGMTLAVFALADRRLRRVRLNRLIAAPKI